MELRLNGADHDAESTEVKQFEEWFARHPTWKPFRCEWSLFDEELLLAGQLDALFVDSETGEYIMADWKRVPELKEEAFRKETGKPPFTMLPNTNLGHYTIQQSAYAELLRRNYGIDVKKMYLVQLHPSLDEAIEVEVKDIREAIRTAFATREAEVKAGRIVAGSKKRKHEPEDPTAAERKKALSQFFERRLREISGQ